MWETSQKWCKQDTPVKERGPHFYNQMKTQTIIIRGHFTISGDIPKNMVTKLKYLEIDAIIPSNPIRIQAFK